MCSILYLPKGISILETSITNMVLNNPDGLGLLVQGDDGRVVQITRQFDPNGTKPSAVIKMLKEHKDKNRLIHVRFNTHGESSLLNVHPFQVYESKDRNVFMMHNGTMHEHKPPQTVDQKFKEYSDSHYFAETFAKAFFSHHTRSGDYMKGISFTLLNKFVPSNNKVVFWGCGLRPLFIGPWITHKNVAGEVTYVTSNTDYFDTVQPSRSVAARKEAASRPTNFMGYQNATLRGGVTGDSTEYTRIVGRTYPLDKTEVGKDTESFFSKLRNDGYQRESEKKSDGPPSVGTTANSYRAITPYNSLSLKPSDLKEMIAEALAKVSVALETINPDDLWDIEGFGLLCQVQPKEWEEVVKKYPTSVPNLMTLMSYALAETETMLQTGNQKAARQQTHIDQMAKQLKNMGGKYEHAA